MRVESTGQIKDEEEQKTNLSSNSSPKLASEKYSHLMIATIKDTSIMFSFFIEASIVEADKNALLMS